MNAVEVDLVALASGFAAALTDNGVPVTAAMTTRFVDAVNAANPQRVDELYWLGMVTLIHDRAQVTIFRRVFDVVFRGINDVPGAQRGGMVPPSTRRASGRQAAEDSAPPPTVCGDTATSTSANVTEWSSDVDRAVMARLMASPQQATVVKPFADCSEAELAQLRALMRHLHLLPPSRLSRRFTRAAHGQVVDLRATLRDSHRWGGDPAVVHHLRRRHRQRRVVLIADVSGSMEPYARAYLYLLHGAVRALRAEAFVFSTGLHRLTTLLATHHPAVAMQRAMASVPEWAGGTRIGEAIRQFNDQHGRRGMARGAVVLIVSDGWEVGEAALLAREMERLSRLAYRIVWVNPRKQAADFTASTAGMRAALPWIDELLSGHSFAALVDVVAALGRQRDQPVSSRP